MKNELYEKDFAEWSLVQANLLKDRKFEELDLVNLIDEVESLATQQASDLRESLILLMLCHMLKEHAPDRVSDLFLDKSRLTNYRMKLTLRDCPSLKSGLFSDKQWCYDIAVTEFGLETRLYDLKFPEECPWDIEEILR